MERDLRLLGRRVLSRLRRVAWLRLQRMARWLRLWRRLSCVPVWRRTLRRTSGRKTAAAPPGGRRHPLLSPLLPAPRCPSNPCGSSLSALMVLVPGCSLAPAVCTVEAVGAGMAEAVDP